MKTGEFKFGQLITINNVVYRCQKVEYGEECATCDINIANDNGLIGKIQYKRTCIRCMEFCKNFKKLSNGKPGR